MADLPQNSHQTSNQGGGQVISPQNSSQGSNNPQGGVKPQGEVQKPVATTTHSVSNSVKSPAPLSREPQKPSSQDGLKSLLTRLGAMDTQIKSTPVPQPQSPNQEPVVTAKPAQAPRVDPMPSRAEVSPQSNQVIPNKNEVIKTSSVPPLAQPVDSPRKQEEKSEEKHELPIAKPPSLPISVPHTSLVDTVVEKTKETPVVKPPIQLSEKPKEVPVQKIEVTASVAPKPGTVPEQKAPVIPQSKPSGVATASIHTMSAAPVLEQKKELTVQSKLEDRVTVLGVKGEVISSASSETATREKPEELVRKFIDLELAEEGFWGKNIGTKQPVWAFVKGKKAGEIFSAEPPDFDLAWQEYLNHDLLVKAYALVRNVNQKSGVMPNQEETVEEFFMRVAKAGALSR